MKVSKHVAVQITQRDSCDIFFCDNNCAFVGLVKNDKETMCIRRVQPTRRKVSQFIYFCNTLYKFQTVFPSIVRSSKLNIQSQVFVRPLLLPAASLVSSRWQYSSDKCPTLYVQFWAPDDGRKNRLKLVQRLTEINKLWNVASGWFYSANVLAMHGPMNVKCMVN